MKSAAISEGRRRMKLGNEYTVTGFSHRYYWNNYQVRKSSVQGPAGCLLIFYAVHTGYSGGQPVGFTSQSHKLRGQQFWSSTPGQTRAHGFIVNAEAIELGQIRSQFLKQAVLWVCELAERDRLEANHAADELRRYFDSVLDSLPPEDREELSGQIEAVCRQLGQLELFSSR